MLREKLEWDQGGATRGVKCCSTLLKKSVQEEGGKRSR